ncbi:MAG: helix-turn-helix domain-containing protein [Roseiflexaceae bacterium]|nr:helix-turn-helix domain-containing protein [Roseiflexaceae bacterium]
MAQMIDGIEYLDGDEVAMLLRVKKATLYAYVSRGLLHSYRQAIGRNRLYRRDEVDQLRAIRPEQNLEDVRGVQQERAAFTWQSLATEEAADPVSSSRANLPDVASWAGDH